MMNRLLVCLVAATALGRSQALTGDSLSVANGAFIVPNTGAVNITPHSYSVPAMTSTWPAGGSYVFSSIQPMDGAHGPFLTDFNSVNFHGRYDPSMGWGYNQYLNGVLARAGEPGLRYSIESQFNDGSGQDKMETYIQFVSADGRTITRPFFTSINRATNKVYQVIFKTPFFRILPDDGSIAESAQMPLYDFRPNTLIAYAQNPNADNSIIMRAAPGHTSNVSLGWNGTDNYFTFYPAAANHARFILNSKNVMNLYSAQLGAAGVALAVGVDDNSGVGVFDAATAQAAVKVLIARGKVGQTEHLFEAQDSNRKVLAFIDKSGNIAGGIGSFSQLTLGAAGHILTDIPTPVAPASSLTLFYSKGGKLCSNSVAAGELCVGAAARAIPESQLASGQITTALGYTPVQIGQDLDGAAAAPRVAGIQGIPVSAATPANGQVLQYQSGQYVPATISGAAGGTFTSGSFASAPTCSSSGAQYYASDAGLNGICDGANWNWFYRGVRVVPANLAGAVWATQNGATMTTPDPATVLLTSQNQSGDAVAAQVKSLPTAPFTVVGCFTAVASGVSVVIASAGVTISDGTQYLTAAFQPSMAYVGAAVSVLQYSNSTTLARNLGALEFARGFVCTAIEDDGVNIGFAVSDDKAHWFTIASTTHTDSGVNPTRIGYFVNGNGAAVQMVLRSFESVNGLLF